MFSFFIIKLFFGPSLFQAVPIGRKSLGTITVMRWRVIVHLLKGQDIHFIWNSALIHMILDYINSWRLHELMCCLDFDCSLLLCVMVIYCYQYRLTDIYFIILIIIQHSTIYFADSIVLSWLLTCIHSFIFLCETSYVRNG